MTMYRKAALLFPLLALGMILAAASVGAQDRNDRGSTGVSATLRVSFGTRPHWTGIDGTRIEELNATDRPSYDIFRYGGTYYAYDNNQWYTSPRESGDFTSIDERSVPTEFTSIPREHWRRYPTGWQGRNDQGSGGMSGTLQVNLGTTPHWTNIGGTRVDELPPTERPDYDVFRYGDTYYVFDNNRWYSSPRPGGDFTVIDDRAVPGDFTSIPREHWRNYPAGWQDRNEQGEDGSSASLQVTFNTTPHWTGIRGTRVEGIAAADRPDYDMFRYGGTYYAYNNNRWYTSPRESGTFTVIDDRLVPGAFSSVPREDWRNYPAAWRDRHDQMSDRTSATLQVNQAYGGRWAGIRGTHAKEMRRGPRPDYDMFYYQGSYYAYSNDRWYTSRRRSGDFTMISDREVPREFMRIPRDHWRNYPSAWLDENGNPRYRHGDRNSQASDGSYQH